MLPISRFRVAQPHEVEPGNILIDARYERAPQLVCQLGEEKALLDLEQRGEPSQTFKLRPMAVNLGPYLVVESFTVEIDYRSTISPVRSDISYGALCVDGEDWSIVARREFYTAYVSLSGTIINQPSYDNFAAFGRWQIVAREGDEVVTLFEYPLPVLNG